MWTLARMVMAIAVAGWLWADAALAVPTPAAQPCAVAGDANGPKLARRRKTRRRPRRRPRRPKPKPARPAAEPEPAAEPAPAPAGGGGPSLGGTTRVEFEAQLIKGQTTKAGEVQILERKDTELKSMVKRRTSFRKEIIHTVFPEK